MQQWFKCIFLICVVTLLFGYHVFNVTRINAAEYEPNQQSILNDPIESDESRENSDSDNDREGFDEYNMEKIVGASDDMQEEVDVESDLSQETLEQTVANDEQETDSGSISETNDQSEQKQVTYHDYLRICTPENLVPTYRQNEPQDYVLEITNICNKELHNIVISPVLQEDGDLWPFRTDFQEYKIIIDVIKPKETTLARFEFIEREDVLEGRYQLTFTIGAADAEGCQLFTDECSFYVNTTAYNIKTEDDDTQQILFGELSDLLSGKYTNGTAAYTNTAKENVNSTVPRVIVTGFDTNPSMVKPGHSFRLTIHLKNTSSKTSVCNLLFELESQNIGTTGETDSPAFFTVNKSNAIYLNKIEKEENADISIDLTAATNLPQNIYQIKLGMKYEDKNAAQIECQSSLSVPVHQDIRFECSKIEIAPNRITVGDEANVTCSIYNLGRVELYNVRIVWEGNSIEQEEVFLGNIQPGTSVPVDVMLRGTKASNNSQILMNIIYENEGAEQFISTERFTLIVEDDQSVETSLQGELSNVEEKEKALPFRGTVFIAVIILVLLGGILYFKKKTHNRIVDMENSWDELDGFDWDKHN